MRPVGVSIGSQWAYGDVREETYFPFPLPGFPNQCPSIIACNTHYGEEKDEIRLLLSGTYI